MKIKIILNLNLSCLWNKFTLIFKCHNSFKIIKNEMEGYHKMAGVKNVRNNKSTSPLVFYSVKMKPKEIY